MKYHHVGIPTSGSFEGEIPLPHLKVTVSDHKNNPFLQIFRRYKRPSAHCTRPLLGTAVDVDRRRLARLQCALR